MHRNEKYATLRGTEWKQTTRKATRARNAKARSHRLFGPTTVDSHVFHDNWVEYYLNGVFVLAEIQPRLRLTARDEAAQLFTSSLGPAAELARCSNVITAVYTPEEGGVFKIAEPEIEGE